MRKTLGTFYAKLNRQSESGLTSEVELLGDEAGQTIRGGDKDYAPNYDEEGDNKRAFNWFSPSILLNL
jgi:hypothetical protein